MLDSTTLSAEAVDEHLRVLAHEQCRGGPLYFCRHSSETASIDDLADFISDQTQQDADATGIETRLHHATLPRLTDADVVEYDPRSQMARDRGTPTLETWAQRVVERGEVAE